MQHHNMTSRSLTIAPTSARSPTASFATPLLSNGRRFHSAKSTYTFRLGTIEHRIRELQDHARTMLMHSSKRWFSPIKTHLYPYALQMANATSNSTPPSSGNRFQANISRNRGSLRRPRTATIFGTPVYLLSNAMTAERGVCKWSMCSGRTRVGNYPGQSPQPAKTIAAMEQGSQCPHYCQQFGHHAPTQGPVRQLSHSSSLTYEAQTSSFRLVSLQVLIFESSK
jgi:hypothetical protein